MITLLHSQVLTDSYILGPRVYPVTGLLPHFGFNGFLIPSARCLYPIYFLQPSVELRHFLKPFTFLGDACWAQHFLEAPVASFWS